MSHFTSVSSIKIYIGSSAIANRLKKGLTYLIPEQQTGFISGRYMSGCTRLIYDRIHFAEYNKIPGLLMLVDLVRTLLSG